MLCDIVKANLAISQIIDADGVIRSGELFGELTKREYTGLHRDTFHASIGLGRYALGLLWYKTLSGKRICAKSFDALDERIDERIKNQIVDIINSDF